MCIINKIAVSILAGKQRHKNISSYATLETDDKTHIFIPVDIMEDAVKLVPQKCLVSSVPGGKDSETLQGWILKFGENRNITRTSVEKYFD